MVRRHMDVSSAPVANKKPPVPTHDTALAERALNESHDLSAELPIEARVLHLTSLCSGAAEMEFLTGRRREWVEELYRLGGQLDPSLRSRAQSSAVAFMAPMDAKRALQMFDGLEPPANSQTDPRPWVARVTFAKVLEKQGAKAIPGLRVRAQRMGENGIYPYIAMVPVLSKLKDQPEKATELFVEALNYYRRGGASPASSNMNFMNLLSGASTLKLIPDWLIHEGALELATRVTRGVENSSDENTPGVWNREKLQFRAAYSLIEDVDAEVAKNMKAQQPSLVSDSDLGDTYRRDPANHKRYTDDAEYQRLRAAVDELIQSIMSMSEDGKGDSPDMQAAISQAMALGVKETQRALDIAPDNAREIRRNSVSLQQVVSAASKIDPDVTLHEIEQISDTELRAYLLIQFASGIRELQFMRETEKTEEAKPVVVRSK